MVLPAKAGRSDEGRTVQGGFRKCQELLDGRLGRVWCHLDGQQSLTTFQSQWVPCGWRVTTHWRLLEVHVETSKWRCVWRDQVRFMMRQSSSSVRRERELEACPRRQGGERSDNVESLQFSGGLFIISFYFIMSNQEYLIILLLALGGCTRTVPQAVVASRTCPSPSCLVPSQKTLSRFSP